MSTHHIKVSMHSVLQLDGLNTEKIVSYGTVLHLEILYNLHERNKRCLLELKQVTRVMMPPFDV